MNGQKDAEMKDRMLQFLGDPLVPTVQQVAEIAATRAGSPGSPSSWSPPFR
jgi:hypothetical protein